jgi:hypothetical protein
MSKRAAPPPNASDAAGPEGQRFRDDLIRALGYAPRGGILLAVSGGPDSMAMLTLARAGGIEGVHVATVDHRLRAEAAAEAAMVADHCRAIGVPHATLTPAEPIGGASIQAAARRARYARVTFRHILLNQRDEPVCQCLRTALLKRKARELRDSLEGLRTLPIVTASGQRSAARASRRRRGARAMRC